ncbi:MAG TPA: hypothetical protein VKG84_10055 [Candidatus Acidoferrales bacterium]|nr:hypothetical protein [Candidatus Acidoferrales bacterium]
MTLPAAENPSSNRFYAGLAAGVALVLLVIGAAVFFSRGTGSANPSGQPAALPFGATEQAYAAKIRISNLKLTQATNMLSQEFTYVIGTVANDGPRSVRAVEVTVEFHDLIHQLVLRETAGLFAPSAGPLASGRERDFQLTFEHVPAGWNHEPPSIRITGLDLQ